MRGLKMAAVAGLCVVGLSLCLSAEQNKYGVADRRTVSFHDPVRVGDVVLPAGDYEVLHTMKGEDHIMVFKQLKKQKPVEAQVKCQLVALPVKAEETQKIFTVNAAGERVLQTLIFRGDLAEHRF